MSGRVDWQHEPPPAPWWVVACLGLAVLVFVLDLFSVI